MNTYLARVSGAVNTADLDVAMGNARYDLYTLKIACQDDNVTPCSISLKHEWYFKIMTNLC